MNFKTSGFLGCTFYFPFQRTVLKETIPRVLHPPTHLKVDDSEVDIDTFGSCLIPLKISSTSCTIYNSRCDTVVDRKIVKCLQRHAL